MFDVGFSELVVIALVALIVIGPERLPRVARTAGALLGRLQRYVNDVKADINREMQLEDLKKIQQQVTDEAKAFEQTVNERMHAIESSLNQSIAQDVADKPEQSAEATTTAGIAAPPSPTESATPATDTSAKT
jgi:sec-independent protein translocase protein TatB